MTVNKFQKYRIFPKYRILELSLICEMVIIRGMKSMLNQ